VEGIVDDLGGRIARPRHNGKGRKVRPEDQVGIGDSLEERLLLFRILAGDGLSEHRSGQRHRIAAEELFSRHQFAAGDPGLVGNDAFDIVDAAGAAPFAGRGFIGDAAGRLLQLFGDLGCETHAQSLAAFRPSAKCDASVQRAAESKQRDRADQKQEGRNRPEMRQGQRRVVALQHDAAHRTQKVRAAAPPPEIEPSAAWRGDMRSPVRQGSENGAERLRTSANLGSSGRRAERIELRRTFRSLSPV
jgi:hypothetical protein